MIQLDGNRETTSFADLLNHPTTDLDFISELGHSFERVDTAAVEELKWIDLRVYCL